MRFLISIQWRNAGGKVSKYVLLSFAVMYIIEEGSERMNECIYV